MAVDGGVNVCAERRPSQDKGSWAAMGNWPWHRPWASLASKWGCEPVGARVNKEEGVNVGSWVDSSGSGSAVVGANVHISDEVSEVAPQLAPPLRATSITKRCLLCSPSSKLHDHSVHSVRTQSITGSVGVGVVGVGVGAGVVGTGVVGNHVGSVVGSAA